MSEIKFFTPVYYGSLANTPEEKAIQNVDSYFHIAGKKAVVLQKSLDGREIVTLKASRISAGTVFKTIGIALSWLTVVIPLVMLIAKAALRSSHKYVLESKINEKGDHGQYLHNKQVISKAADVQPAVSKESVEPVYKAPNLPAHPTTEPEITARPSKEAMAATALQKFIRGYNVRRPFKEPDIKVPPYKEVMAATAMQKYIRGYNVRRPLLPEALYPHYKEECAKAQGPESKSIPRARGGRTIVYLPKDLPGVVLKMAGRRGSVNRFHQMQDVRKILEAQDSTHLVIPRASLCEEFLVEQRLPIDTDNYTNMGLYLSNPRLFDDAVREMTRLFSKIELTDLVNEQLNPLSHIEGVEDIPRYDNMPLYVEEENGKMVGKIGLIDLEHMREPLYVPHIYSQTLARIFPLHEKIIREEAERLKFQTFDSDYAKSVEKGRKFLKVGYLDHLEYIKKKDMQAENSLGSIVLRPERVGALIDAVSQELLRLNRGENDLIVRKGGNSRFEISKDFICENPEEAANHLAQNIAPKIVANLKAIIEEARQKNACADLSEAKMISQRSLIVNKLKIFVGIRDIILASNKFGFQDDTKRLVGLNYVAEQLAYVVLKELERGGEIFYYSPAEYADEHHLCWIRY